MNGLAPISVAEIGKPLQDCRALLVPADAPPGIYTVIAGLYDRGTGERLSMTNADGSAADHAVLGKVEIVTTGSKTAP
jgi:hypothetical protein